MSEAIRDRSWIDAEKELPPDGDYSVLVAFNNGSVEDLKMVHVQDWVRDNMYRHGNMCITHWMYMPDHPSKGGG